MLNILHAGEGVGNLMRVGEINSQARAIPTNFTCCCLRAAPITTCDNYGISLIDIMLRQMLAKFARAPNHNYCTWFIHGDALLCLISPRDISNLDGNDRSSDAAVVVLAFPANERCLALDCEIHGHSQRQPKPYHRA